MYERLELSEEVDPKSMEKTAIQATLALSQTKEGRTGQEIPIIIALQTYTLMYEGTEGGGSNDWLSLMKYMIKQFCNFKVLLQENCYKVALFPVGIETGGDKKKETNIFKTLLYLRNNGGISGQLGMKDIQTDEFPIQKIIKVYNSIPPKDVNKVERNRLYGLINQMLYVSPERILLCEHVYRFLNARCIYNFLTRCGGVRNVLLQMDSNGNTPIFFAIENLNFQGNNDPIAIKNRKLFKYMIKGGVVQNENNDKDNNNNSEGTDDTVTPNFGDTVLRSHDASFKNSRDTALHRAVYYEKVYAVEEILKQDSSIRRIKNSDGLTPLQINIELGKNSPGTSAQGTKIRRILSGELEFEKLLQKKQIKNGKVYVKVPFKGTKGGFLISELLEMDTQERDLILIIKGRNIPYKKESDISVLPENLHKFETAKYRVINAVKQIECKFFFKSYLYKHLFASFTKCIL